MRILLTTDTIGGVWSFTSTLARSLLDDGHTVGLVSFGRLPSADQYLIVKTFILEFPDRFYFVPSDAPLEWMPENGSTWDTSSRVLLKVIRDFAPELLHSSQMCFGRLNCMLPVLVTVHSDVLSWAESTLGPEGVARLRQTASEMWLSMYNTLVRTGLHSAAIVVTPTYWMAKAISFHFKLDVVPEVLFNGISPCPVNASSPRKLQAVTVGRLWDEGKGLSILNGIQPPLRFLLVGESQSKHTLSNDGLERLGQLPHHDLLSLYSESAIYVATSLYEPFGLAPVEAAERGCAIIARDIPSFREVWGDAALYFTSTSSLQELIDKLTTDPTLLRKAQRQAGLRAARYTAQAMTDGYLALYDRLLSSSEVERKSTFAHA